MSSYLWLNILVIIIPFLGSFEKRVRYHQKWQHVFKAIFLTLIPFIIWDSLFAHFGIWHFNPNYVSSFSVFGLPIDEWLFFITVPYSCLYIYEWVKYFRRGRAQIYGVADRFLLIILCGATLLTAFFFYSKSYTLVVFGSVAYFLIFVIANKPVFIRNFWIAFIISMVPFLIVNGYLTAKPVVMYNSHEFIGLRLFTIPLEDVFYSFLLLLMNTFFYEQSLSREL
ncbi:MAG TPA: lycopene cyclase domain-containing protein [Balneolales bacterium]|nr:lycopene cyclase domain-containing protein [Balneolales bacterium]